MTTYLSNAQGTTIGPYANFQSVAGNSTITYNNYNDSQRGDWITVKGKKIRTVMDSDIEFLRLLSSEIRCVDVKPDDEASTSSDSQVVKVKKRVQTAKIVGCRGRFTATTLEPVSRKDQDKFREIARCVLEAAVCHRSALVMQRFAIQSLRDDEALPFLVTGREEDWPYNLKTHSWHYDPVSLSLNPPTVNDLQPLLNHYPPLCQDTIPRLNATEIVAHVEENLGNFLYLIASSGGNWIDNLSDYARNGLLTFGAVIQRRNPEILAHVPSTPSPELFCQSRSSNVKVRYSNSGRVDLTFRKTGATKVEIHFGLRIPYSDRLCAAYLCQSLHFRAGCRDVKDVIFIDEVGFELKGTFFEDPTTHPTPAYLFISPLRTELVNGLHCVRFPFPQSLVYWSSDLHGRNKIDKEEWEKLGIPELSMMDLIGTHWVDEDYATVHELLCQKNYDLDGKQYAFDYGYSELILGDPHDTTRIEDLDDLGLLDCDVQPSTLQLASPSTYSLVETSPDSLLESEHMPSLLNKITVTPNCWMKGFLNKYYLKLSDREVKASKAAGTGENLGEWDVIEREDV
ncbi:hypothetical protein PQX77_003141 [Marasmius sp. AFHP31]|nr:hypothetical protein PQX77_003141 [Marasmius sp. AFHP31]